MNNITKAEFKKRYNEEKKFFLDYWRPIIFKRDNYRCINCGSKRKLQLAHITPCYDFVKNYGFEQGMTISFQMDNLACLCETCHMIHHMSIDGIRLSYKKQKIARGVSNIFDKFIEKRGWKGTGVKSILKKRQKRDIHYLKKKGTFRAGAKKKNITSKLTRMIENRIQQE